MTILAQPNTPEWLEQRRAGIGASEIAAVMGISPWESPLSLYWRKVNGWEADLSAVMEWGNRLEDAVAAKFAEEHSSWVVHPCGLLAHPFRPWQMATPDRLLCDPQGHDNPFPEDPSYIHEHPDQLTHGVLDVKTAHSADGWGETGTADIPVYYRTQLLWQMNIVGVNVGYLAVLIGGSDYREYVVPMDTRDLEVMLEHGRRFMDRLARRDPPPIDDHAATLTTLKRLHPDITDDEAEVPEDIAAGYARAVRMERLAKQAKTRYEAQLRDAMGGAHYATTGGRKVATRVITEVAGYAVGDHIKDYLLPPKGKKS